MNSHDDKTLGMQQSITRRDFLNATLLASGSLLLSPVSPSQLLASSAPEDDWTGYSGVGDYANSNGNTRAGLEAGHRIRDGIFKETPANTDLTGVMDHRYSIIEADRVVSQLLDQVLSG